MNILFLCVTKSDRCSVCVVVDDDRPHTRAIISLMTSAFSLFLHVCRHQRINCLLKTAFGANFVCVRACISGCICHVAVET